MNVVSEFPTETKSTMTGYLAFIGVPPDKQRVVCDTKNTAKYVVSRMNLMVEAEKLLKNIHKITSHKSQGIWFEVGNLVARIESGE